MANAEIGDPSGSGAQPRAGPVGGPADLDLETPRQRSERYLGLLGLPTKDPPDVDAICRLLEPITSRTGKSRRRRLENCGVAYPALDVEGRLCWERRGCRDRFCVECSVALLNQRTAIVRDFWAVQRARGAEGVFLTLTQPKDEREDTRAATRRALDTWRRLAHADVAIADGVIRRRGKGEPPLLVGGLRSLELTARVPGTIVRKGQRSHKVNVGGVHAHLHVVAELRPVASPAEASALRSEVARRIIAAWTEIADAEPAAQDVQPISDGNIHEACNYATNFAGLAALVDVAPRYARDVVLGLHSRRLVDTWGTWRGILRKKPQGLRFGDRSISSLISDPGQRVYFGRGVMSLPAEEILGELAGGARSWGELRKADKAMARELERDYFRDLEREAHELERKRLAARAAARMDNARQAELQQREACLDVDLSTRT